MEIYNNTMVMEEEGNNSWYGILTRGGTGVFFNNTFRALDGTSFSQSIRLVNYRATISAAGSCAQPLRSCMGSHPYDGNTVEFSGTHSGSNNSSILTQSVVSWTRDAYTRFRVFNLTDGSSCEIEFNSRDSLVCELTGGLDNDWDAGDQFEIRSGYPCYGQPGRGPDGPDADSIQDLEPVYQWNNSCDGYHQYGCKEGKVVTIVNTPERNCLTKANTVVDERDYFDEKPRPGYVPYVYPHPLATAYSDLGL